jgi:hypothetical protein
MELSAQAGLDVSIGERLGRIEAGLASLAVASTLTSRTTHITGNSSATVLHECGGPSGGLVWNVRRVTLSPSAIGASITAGTLYICKGQKAVGQQIIVDIAPTIPNAATYSADQFVLRYPDLLIIAWVDGAGVLLVDMDAVEQRLDEGLVSIA